MAIIEDIDERSVVPSRKLTAQGVTFVRGGQTVGDSFFTSALAAVANITYHPIALISVAFAVFMFAAEWHQKDGPLEQMLAVLTTVTTENKEKPYVITLAKFVKGLISHTITHKDIYSIVFVLAASPIAKPSTRNIITAVFIFVIMVFAKYTFIEMFIFSASFYLFVMMRNPLHKLWVFLFVLVFFFVDKFIHIASTGGVILDALKNGSRTTKP